MKMCPALKNCVVDTFDTVLKPRMVCSMFDIGSENVCYFPIRHVSAEGHNILC